ncbi:MAG: multiple sugar transport system permease protein [Thermomicrobiales bacterium]|jgi:multiple sugar transport system permease protein|nr:multiple sugar transport system permease protein [Thermomicrobiales bacterium]MEA2526364.1 multiple sugar transport system permease protein [Thermomicrobiales bacterium]MEA2594822.1 multiple sugar transport system permease protein [Thermomicrobiales bacterium]
MATTVQPVTIDRPRTGLRAWVRQPRSEKGAATLLLLPSLAFLVAMTVIPTVYSLWLSMRQYNLSRPDLAHWVGLRNYQQQLQDDLFWKALNVSLTFTVSVLVLEFVLGFLIATLLDRKMRGMGFVRTLFVIPVFASPVAMGLTWRYMYQPGYGLINFVLEAVGLPRVNWLASVDWAMPAVVIVDVWQWTPFVALILLAGMQSISTEIAEAAELDGLTKWQYMMRMVIPLIRPVVVVIGLIRLIDALKTFDLIYIITRGGPGTATYSLPLHAYSIGFASFLMGKSAAIAWIIVIVINIFTIVFLRILAKDQA